MIHSTPALPRIAVYARAEKIVDGRFGFRAAKLRAIFAGGASSLSRAARGPRDAGGTRASALCPSAQASARSPSHERRRPQVERWVQPPTPPCWRRGEGAVRASSISAKAEARTTAASCAPRPRVERFARGCRAQPEPSIVSPSARRGATASTTAPTTRPGDHLDRSCASRAHARMRGVRRATMRARQRLRAVHAPHRRSARPILAHADVRGRQHERRSLRSSSPASSRCAPAERARKTHAAGFSHGRNSFADPHRARMMSKSTARRASPTSTATPPCRSARWPRDLRHARARCASGGTRDRRRGGERPATMLAASRPACALPAA